jgi:peptidoglycan/xylan/chitin deacetylase (PgdA/CDA1 family)
MDLILTLDYELYGNGSGDVFKTIIDPMNQILDILDANNIKATIFFEVVEYWKLKEEWAKNNYMGYLKNPVEAMEKQIISAASNGHDIQLHIHPQWLDSYYDNKWILNMNDQSLGQYSLNKENAITNLLYEGKQTIENLLRPVVPEYECTALRAGGYYIMPSHRIYDAMVDVGLKIDSSIYSGGYENSKSEQYDYRDISDELDFWYAKSDDMRQRCSSSEVIEMPIFALSQARWRKLNKYFFRSSIRNMGSSFGSFKNKNRGLTYFEIFKSYLKKHAITWDFCLFNPDMHKRYFRYISRKLGKREFFVVTGHPKSFNSAKSLNSLIELSYKHDYKYSSITEVYKRIVI